VGVIDRSVADDRRQFGCRCYVLLTRKLTQELGLGRTYSAERYQPIRRKLAKLLNYTKHYGILAV